MDERHKLILGATVDQYIETAEPVGSTALVKKYQLGVSSATVRQSLSQLEEKGYLTQMHTSSGRVPTDKGYRLYVDTIMEPEISVVSKQRSLIKEMGFVGLRVEQILEKMSYVLSSLVDYTTIILTPDIYRETLKVAHFISLDVNRILVVLLNAVGVNSEILLQTHHDIDQEELNKISKLLTQKLKGQSIETLNETMFTELITELPKCYEILKLLYKEVVKIRQQNAKDRKLLCHGTSKMLKLPEFKNIEFTQQVMTTLEENKVLLNVLQGYLNTQNSKNTQVVIGDENKIEGLKDCSIVIAPYQEEGQSQGLIGILGPKRMPYTSMVPMVRQISDMVEHHIKQREIKNEVDII